MPIEAVDDLFADVQVEGVLGGPEQEVGGLDKLWTERVKFDVGLVAGPVEPLGKYAEPTPDGVVVGVLTDGLLQVAVQDLQACVCT